MNIRKEMERAMTVGQLIEFLEGVDKDAVVTYSYPSGDYWRSQLASTVQEIGEAKVEYSEYHRQYQVVDCDKEDPDDKDQVSVVMIF